MSSDRLIVWAAFSALCLACFSAPPQAPEDLDELSRFMYRQWDHESPQVLEEAVLNLEEALERLDFSSKMAERSFSLAPLTPEDLADVQIPEGRDPADALGVAVAYESAWPVQAHARFQGLADHTEGEPSAQSYVRSFIEPEDPACFVERSCPLLITRNAVTRSNLFMTIDLVLQKHFRWVSLPEGRRAIVSRAWNAESFSGEGKNESIFQSYTLDVWIEQPGGRTRRHQALWQESNVGASAGDETVAYFVADGIQKVYEATDAYIEAHF